MKCPSCGRECGEEVNFCFYCGHSFRENPVHPVNIQQGFSQAPDVPPYFPENSDEVFRRNGENEDVKSMRPWQWALYFALLIIPYTGLLWFVLTIVWAFSDKSSAERKSFSKGLLAFLAIVVVMTVITSIYLIATLGTDGAINYLTGGMATSADALMQQYCIQ